MRAHGEVILLEGPPEAELDGAVGVSGPLALLKTRRPDPSAVLSLLREQMDMVRGVLERMAPEAEQETYPARRAAFDALRERAKELADKIALLE